MIVKELIELLQTFPQDLPVAFPQYSEYRLLEAADIAVQECSYVRDDGWVHEKRPDRETMPYLMFPGN